MKQIYFSILVVIFGCKTISDKPNIKLVNYNIPSDKGINLTYDVYDVCSTYYYRANDTLNPILSKIVRKDKQGNDKEINYLSYENYVPATCIIYYDSSSRQTLKYYRIDESSYKGKIAKNVFYYNSLGKLSSSISFDYLKRIRKNVDKGFGRPGGCIITDEDYDTAKSWELETIWNYKYDSQGRLIEKNAPYINSTQDKYTYEYDGQGRLSEEKSLEGTNTIWVEKYFYGERFYKYTRTWFERDGTRSKNSDNTLQSVDTFLYKTDNNNNITAEIITEKGGQLVSKDTMYYDNKNRITRRKIYDELGTLLGFYIHKYYSHSEPITRNFLVLSK
jgi:YD repeat-containing protein